MKRKYFLLFFILLLVIICGIAVVFNLWDILPVAGTASSNKIEENISEPVAEEETGENATGEERDANASGEETGATATTQENSIDTSAELSTELSIVITSGINNTTKKIALTFDAGWEYANAEALLNLLYGYNIKATFFTRGMWVKDHPDLAIGIVTGGHSLENHSLNHGHMVTMTDEEVRNEISQTTRIIKDITDYQPGLFRPPYGEYDERILRILKEEGYPYTILWTVDSHDWAEELNGVKITKDYVVNRVLNNASDGGIILMHVGGYETVNALPEIIDGLRAKGYELVKVEDML